MLFLGLLAVALQASAAYLPAQIPLDSDLLKAPHHKPKQGHKHQPHQAPGHFSRWAEQTKKDFLSDLAAGNVSHWTLVMGTQASDTDSLVSALTYAYSLSHRKDNPSPTVALLQFPADAVDLRPENALVLDHAHMAHGHNDILTLDDLPLPRGTLATDIKGVVLVDHNVLLPEWSGAKVLAVIDHHLDRGGNFAANPRLIDTDAKSCSSLVGWEIWQHEHVHSHGQLPREIAALLMSAIAIDTKGLKNAQWIDNKAARDLLPYSFWAGRELEPLMKDLGDELKKAESDLGHLTAEELMRRDWKNGADGDTREIVHIGFANLPISLGATVRRMKGNLSDWFELESNFSRRALADLTVTETKFKSKKVNSIAALFKSKKEKHRELVLTAKSFSKLSDEDADSVFKFTKSCLEDNLKIDIVPWKGPGHKEAVVGRRMIWNQRDSDEGRKTIRPLTEVCVKMWDARRRAGNL